MGRPLMILHKFSTSQPSPLDNEKPQSMHPLGLPAIGSFLQGIKLSNTLGIILTSIYDQNISQSNTSASDQKHVQTPAEIDAVLELDKRLTKFQSELPIELFIHSWYLNGADSTDFCNHAFSSSGQLSSSFARMRCRNQTRSHLTLLRILNLTWIPFL